MMDEEEDEVKLKFRMSRTLKVKHAGYEQNFNFAVVGTKLVWFDFNQKTVWHFDITDYVQMKQDAILWHQTSCKGFTVKDITEGITREAYLDRGIYLGELGENSTLRTKKIKESHDGSLTLMQLTIDDHTIVYNLQENNRFEVALMHDIMNFTDPIKFGMTGFEFQTISKSLVVNQNNSLGFQKQARGTEAQNHLGLIRAFAEIDLAQVKFINDLIINKSNTLQKSDLKEIEPETTVSDFEGETFFSLFSEQDLVYEVVFDQMTGMETDEDRNLIRSDVEDGVASYIRHLSYVLDKPTPLRVKDNDYLTNFSILKQCLLFQDIKASVMIYKIAKLIPQLDFEDYISSQEDLEVVVERLPAQQYLPIFNTFSENYHTRMVNEAILQKKAGQVAQLTVFIQNSAVICQKTP